MKKDYVKYFAVFFGKRLGYALIENVSVLSQMLFL